MCCTHLKQSGLFGQWLFKWPLILLVLPCLQAWWQGALDVAASGSQPGVSWTGDSQQRLLEDMSHWLTPTVLLFPCIFSVWYTLQTCLYCRTVYDKLQTTKYHLKTFNKISVLRILSWHSAGQTEQPMLCQKTLQGIEDSFKHNIGHRILTARAHPYHAEVQMLAT